MKNEDLWKATKHESAEILLKRRRWTCIGHILKKPSNSITRRVLQWKPQGQRRRGIPQNTWRRGVKQEMKEAHLTWGTMETTAQDRAQWRQRCLCSTTATTKSSKPSHSLFVCLMFNVTFSTTRLYRAIGE